MNDSDLGDKIVIGVMGILFVLLIGGLITSEHQDSKAAEYDAQHPHQTFQATVVDVRSAVKTGDPAGDAMVGYILFGPLGAIAGASDASEQFCRVTLSFPDGFTHSYEFTNHRNPRSIKGCVLAKKDDKVLMRWDWRSKSYYPDWSNPENGQ